MQEAAAGNNVQQRRSFNPCNKIRVHSSIIKGNFLQYLKKNLLRKTSATAAVGIKFS
jgi:hypothetical protein